MKDSKQKVPPQYEGAKSDIKHQVQAVSNDEAERLYIRARRHLIDINRWQELAGKLSAEFRLIDAQGSQIDRTPQEGDYIRIHLPASAQDKFDWVRIERVEEERPDDYSNRFTIRVRPAHPPAKGETAHFFTSDATSSFFVERKGKVVTAMVRGRNELPNLNAHGWFNKLRNAVIAVAAMAGLNTPQWKWLVKGILEKREPLS